MKVKVSSIKASPDNVKGRKPDKELIDTVRAVGLVNAISVFPHKNGVVEFEIIDGERDWRAAKKVGLEEVEVTVHNVTREQARLMRLAALSHEDWSDEEFAEKAWDECRHRSVSAEALAKKVGLAPVKVQRAIALHAGKLEGSVVKIDGEIAVYQTYTLNSAFSDNALTIKPHYMTKDQAKEVRKAVADKMNDECVEAKPSEKLC